MEREEEEEGWEVNRDLISGSEEGESGRRRPSRRGSRLEPKSSQTERTSRGRGSFSRQYLPGEHQFLASWTAPACYWPYAAPSYYMMRNSDSSIAESPSTKCSCIIWWDL